MCSTEHPTIDARWIARVILPGFASLNVAKSRCSIAGQDCVGGEQLLREGPKSQGDYDDQCRKNSEPPLFKKISRFPDVSLNELITFALSYI